MSGERERDAQDVEPGKRLSALREAAGYERQLDPGAIAGIGPVEVSRIESSKHRLTSDTVRSAYAKAFGVTTGTLTDYIDGSRRLEEVKSRRHLVAMG